jgi:hypothetical protein
MKKLRTEKSMDEQKKADLVYAKKNFRRAKEGKELLGIGCLDLLMDNGYKPEQFYGLAADWHGRKGTIAATPYGEKTTAGVKVRVPCDRGCGRRLIITTVSAVHRGAFCVVVQKGQRVADLRDQDTLCSHCASTL